jgi:uncharacterized protein YjbI with pentapeptide repeats
MTSNITAIKNDTEH